MTDLRYNRQPVKCIRPYYGGRDKVIDNEGEKKFSFTAIFLDSWFRWQVRFGDKPPHRSLKMQ